LKFHRRASRDVVDADGAIAVAREVTAVVLGGAKANADEPMNRTAAAITIRVKDFIMVIIVCNKLSKYVGTAIVAMGLG
jgi:hypothetical protein